MENDLGQVISEVEMLEEGGTLASNLGRHALQNNFDAELYTFNLKVFDPSWFKLSNSQIIAKLEEQLQYKNSPKHRQASLSYIDFLRLGGKVSYQDLTPDLLKKYLDQAQPIIVGLSSTYLYQCSREDPNTMQMDDVKGDPAGHFVVISSIQSENSAVMVSDPYVPNPISKSHFYKTDLNHLICAILLGVVTYDANLLILKPKT